MYEIINTEPTIFITDEYKLINKLGESVESEYTSDHVEITMGGKSAVVSRDWLYKLATSNVTMLPRYAHRVFDFRFEDTRLHRYSKIVDGIIPVLTVPITLNFNDELYRIISSYSRYAISREGVVLDTITRKLITYSGTNDYARIMLYIDSDHTIRRAKRIHRLVAMAWCPNDDWMNKIVVNHIDGNPSNYVASNVEWATYQENNRHAIDTGLRMDNLKVMIRNIHTGVVSSYVSISLAVDAIGRSRMSTTYVNMVNTGKVIYGTNGEFEMKYADDTTPWLSEVNPRLLITRNVKMRVRIIYDDYEYLCVSVDDIRDVANIISDTPTIFGSDRFTNAVSVFQTRFPDVELIIERMAQYADTECKYLCIPVDGGDTITVDTRAEAITVTGGTKSAIQKSIITNGAYPSNGWIVKKDDDTPVAPRAEIKNTPVELILTNIYTGFKTVFTSLRQAAAFLNVDKATISKASQLGNIVCNHTVNSK